MILIVDFGSQTTDLIARRLRSLGIETQIVEPEKVHEMIGVKSPKGIILSGGPSSVNEALAPTIDPTIFDVSLPVLGICYGWQLMARLLGGGICSANKEYGPEQIEFHSNVFRLQAEHCQVYMSHGDTVVKLPEGFTSIASTHNCINAAAANIEKRLYGLQFHPEVDHTEQGIDLLSHYAINICGCRKKVQVSNPLDLVKQIQHQVGCDKVICGVSGGVDSTVAAYLIAKAVGNKLIPIYIDSGLMRKDTLARVRYTFETLMNVPLIVIECKELFLAALKGINDPEEKRKIIGKLYIDLFEEESLKHPGVIFLAQGTIYSDVIESKGSTHASTIKSHHNVGGLPKEMTLRLLEPLRHLYKDEVRALGEVLGIPKHLIMEHPFPGPGYAVRIRGEVTEKRLAQVQQADDIVMEEMEKAGLLDTVFQCFALMTGAYSTSVKGDAREFSEVVAVRAYESVDVMTSEWAKLPYDLLQRLSSRIVSEVPEVSRVVYDITTKPPATMEWE